jgi:hypothetical protein
LNPQIPHATHPQEDKAMLSNKNMEKQVIPYSAQELSLKVCHFTKQKPNEYKGLIKMHKHSQKQVMKKSY